MINEGAPISESFQNAHSKPNSIHVETNQQINLLAFVFSTPSQPKCSWKSIQQIKIIFYFLWWERKHQKQQHDMENQFKSHANDRSEYVCWENKKRVYWISIYREKQDQSRQQHAYFIEQRDFCLLACHIILFHLFIALSLSLDIVFVVEYERMCMCVCVWYCMTFNCIPHASLWLTRNQVKRTEMI